MADGVLTSSLEQTWCKLFFGMQALPKNRGACVDTWFWHNAECNGDGLKWQNILNEKFHIAEWNNFDVWTIIIRHHIKDQNYTQIVMFRCSECFLVKYASRTISDEGMLYMNCLRLVESVDFDIKIISIRVRMQKLELSGCSPVKRRNMTRKTRHVLASVWCNAWVFWPRRWPRIGKRSTWKFFVSSKRLTFLLDTFSSEVVYCLKNLAGESLPTWTVTLPGKACRREQ